MVGRRARLLRLLLLLRLRVLSRRLVLSLLRTLRPHDVPLARMLEQATLSQLETLSSCIGARPLEP